MRNRSIQLLQNNKLFQNASVAGGTRSISANNSQRGGAGKQCGFRTIMF